MNAFLSTLVLAAGLTQASSGAAASQNAYERSRLLDLTVAQNQASQPEVLSSTVITSGDSLIGELSLPEQAQENVLVVPTPGLPAESLADLTEDLSVMCRIFDKSVPATYASTGSLSGMYGEPGRVFRYSTGQQIRQTQGLYLDGYGALFFVHVGYPLMPTEPQEPSEAKAKEPVDSVWSQTIEEMSGRQEAKTETGRAAETYDPQKVENLKRTLIKTLAHASNIRMRRPQDVVTLVVGALDDSRASDYRRSSTARFGTSATSPVRPGTAKSQPAVRNSPAALLILRVTKAEVDAFAKGQLTLAQFTEKVRILSSPISPGPTATPASTPTPTSSRR